MQTGRSDGPPLPIVLHHIQPSFERRLNFVTGPVDSMKLLWRNYALSARGYGISARNILATKFRPTIYQDSSAIDRSEA